MRSMRTRPLAILLVMLVLVAGAPGAQAADPPPPPAAPPADVPSATPPATAPDTPDADASLTPPRLGYASGDVSFWRPGGDDWAPAQVNTPLAPGDQLYTGNNGNLEMQFDSRTFVRAWGDSQLGLENHTAGFIQVKIAAGHVALDLRSQPAGGTVELDTPAAAFSIDRPGYYRVDVTATQTSFITRRGGTSTMTPAGGEAVAIAASEQVVLAGNSPGVQTFVAPDLDTWDRWNYARTDALIDAVSARYLPADISGIDDLDHAGTWRVVPDYGSVWVPDNVAPDWAPYTTGRWIMDPAYGWSWVDTAPWGWAPYHYGRWVYLGNVWAWAPGPIVVRPPYAPALVAFFGAPGVQVAVGSPFVSWVALGWGEPCVPWWGRSGFVGRPWWGGWGGPRVVNNVVINRTTVVNVDTINVYRNVGVRNAVVAVRPDRFGRGPVSDGRIRQVDTQRLAPVRGALPLAPDRASFAAASGRAVHPPDSVLSRQVVATRAPATRALPHEAANQRPGPRLVSAPQPADAGATHTRPPFGQGGTERPRRPQAPSFDSTRRPPTPAPAARTQERPAPAPESVRPSAPPARAPEARAPEARPADRPAAPAPAAPSAPRAPVEAARPQRPESSAPPARAPEPAVRAPEPATRPTIRPSAPPVAQRPPAPAAVPHAPAPAPHPAAPAPRAEPPRAQPRQLPGEPANRLYPGRVERSAPHGPSTRPLAHPRPAPASAPARGGHAGAPGGHPGAPGGHPGARSH